MMDGSVNTAHCYLRTSPAFYDPRGLSLDGAELMDGYNLVSCFKLMDY